MEGAPEQGPKIKMEERVADYARTHSIAEVQTMLSGLIIAGVDELRDDVTENDLPIEGVIRGLPSLDADSVPTWLIRALNEQKSSSGEGLPEAA